MAPHLQGFQAAWVDHTFAPASHPVTQCHDSDPGLITLLVPFCP
jgi:hypothetical protein